jgi:hypothetical protein
MMLYLRTARTAAERQVAPLTCTRRPARHCAAAGCAQQPAASGCACGGGPVRACAQLPESRAQWRPSQAGRARAPPDSHPAR